MKVIGLCGGSGSGKSTVCDFFADLGINSVNTDKLYHEIISTDSECTMELVRAFGSEVYANPGINRRALREIVFASPENLRLLNEITHKHILEGVRERIKTEENKIGIIIDAPLLFESSFDKECDLTVCVVADEEVRVERIIKRDSISIESARKRIASQIKDSDLVKRCTYSIDNSSTEEELKKQVIALYTKMFNN